MNFLAIHARLPGTLILLLTVLGLQACATTAQPRNTDNVCSIFEEKRGWHKVAKKAEDKWGVSMHIPMAFMYQESAFKAKARPKRSQLYGLIPWRRPSSAYGYAQAVNGTWRDYLNATGEYWRVRHDFADATDFIHWYIQQASRINGIATTDAYNLYLNYHEGPGGYARNSYAAKPWLIRAAKNVQKRSKRYSAQYQECRDSLSTGFFSRLFGD